jgi:hypothetical protein
MGVGGRILMMGREKWGSLGLEDSTKKQILPSWREFAG